MERITQFRSRLLLLFLAALLMFFAVRLYDLQVIETGGKVDNTTTYTTKTRVKAARGEILDRNGNVLVGNRASYDLVINHFVLTSSSNPNQSIYNLVKLCQELGIEYTDRFPITKERPFTYTLEEYNSAWQGYFQKFLYSRGGLDSDISAPLLIEMLRSNYKIPEEWSDEEARLVLGIRYELTLRTATNLANYIFIEDASEEDLSDILELNIPGLNVEASTVREYYTEYAAHILGYVGPMTADQWTHYKSVKGYAMDAEVGQSGFELAFEEYLHATDGYRVDEVAADGTVISSYFQVEPQAGNNVEVTIDIGLQRAAEDALKARIEELRYNQKEGAAGTDVEGGAVVAIDPRTGQILVCASYPTYDLANLRSVFNDLLQTDYNPLFNRALSAEYYPGSTYKPCMVVAATKAGFINMETEIEDLGVFTEYENFSPKCLHYTQTGLTHGFINAAQALCVSCNYFFYEIGDKINWQYMDDTAKGFGLGEPTGAELPEKPGQRANPGTKKKIYDEGYNIWVKADGILAAIGQSDNKFTPLQLCVYTATLANRGTRMRATFLSQVVSTDYRTRLVINAPEAVSHMTISDDAYLSYIEGMRLAAREGTARTIFADYPIDVCAKTGTAQHDIRDQSDHGAFMCFAPATNPTIAVYVYGEKSGSGSAMGPVAKAILDMHFEVGEVGDVTTYENQVS